jgi:phospholipid transport system transporter-binding protein
MKLPSTTSFAQFRELLAELRSREVEMIDARELKAFDTATVALLLEAQRLAQSRGAKCEVRGMPPKLRELAVLYGVEELLS